MFFNDLDQTGWRLSLQEPPKRIVSLVPSQTELLHNLGVMNFLVGRTKFCIHPNEIQAIPVVGGTKQINRKRLLEVNRISSLGTMRKIPRRILSGSGKAIQSGSAKSTA